MKTIVCILIIFIIAVSITCIVMFFNKEQYSADQNDILKENDNSEQIENQNKTSDPKKFSVKKFEQNNPEVNTNTEGNVNAVKKKNKNVKRNIETIQPEKNTENENLLHVKKKHKNVKGNNFTKGKNNPVVTGDDQNK